MSDKVLITGPSLAPAAVAVLEAAGLAPAYVPPYSAGDGLVDAVRAASPVGIISRMGRIDAAVFEAAPRLRVIAKHGVGVDNIDLQQASAHGVPVLVATGANAVSVAEHAMALLFAVAKRIVALDGGLRAGRWEKPGFRGRELAGSSLGLVAFGAIARQTAVYARAFGMDVMAYDPFCPSETVAAAGVTAVKDLDDLVARCDILSLHSPLTPETRNMIDARRLSLMKPDAILINTARGGLIDEGALAAALAEGRIAGAGLDTFAQEPPAADHPFWREPRLVMTPHIGGVTEAANARVGIEAAQGIVDLLSGRPVPSARIVNRAALAAHPVSP
ncbi:hydroxyacid dehydrogenase [Rhodobacter sp. CZR27]|uniref:hydroxyacid dehydrogenase n=1 Tax=Rhodobacter sp. CZR27 TaxID=2033869 RepID=UPI000BBE41D7|nr:hydroxyacid dehydrogenase [Rhodobacter sp. CZR27]